MEGHDLTEGNIPDLVKMLAVPASVGFFFHTMYNVVDTYYAGLLGTEAQAALALSFPVFFIIIALGSGVGTAVNVLVSHSLGAKQKDRARRFVEQSFSYALIASAILTVIGFFITPLLFSFLGASDENYLRSAMSYMIPVLYGAVLFLLVYTFNSILTSRGDTKSFRNALIVGFFLNIILNPLFMFGFGPIPALGITGIAFATILIEGLTMVYLGYKVYLTGLLKGAKLAELSPDLKVYKEFFVQGFPASLNMMAIAIGIFVFTFFVGLFGKEAVASFGIASRIEQIMFLPAIGLQIAVLTLTGHNFGAGKIDRIREAFKVTFKYGIMITGVGMILLLLFPTQLMGFFSSDTSVISMGVPFLRIAAVSLWSYLLIFLLVSLMQGLKKPIFALIMGIFREVLAPIAVLYLVVYVFAFGLLGVWWSMFIVYWLAAIVTIIFSKKELDKLGI